MTVPRTPRARAAAGGTTGFGGGLLVVWLAGHLGIEIGAEEGYVIAGVATALGTAIAHDGLVGVGRRLLFGKPRP